MGAVWQRKERKCSAGVAVSGSEHAADNNKKCCGSVDFEKKNRSTTLTTHGQVFVLQREQVWKKYE